MGHFKGNDGEWMYHQWNEGDAGGSTRGWKQDPRGLRCIRKMVEIEESMTQVDHQTHGDGWGQECKRGRNGPDFLALLWADDSRGRKGPREGGQKKWKF